MRPAFAPPAAGALWAINGDEDSTALAPARRTDSINSRREARKREWRSASGFGESAESFLLCARTRPSPQRFLNRWPQRVFHTGYPRQVGWRAARVRGESRSAILRKRYIYFTDGSNRLREGLWFFGSAVDLVSSGA